MTGPALRAFVKRKVIAAAPEAAEQRRASARTARRVDKPFGECDGMGSMQIYGPIEDLAPVFTAGQGAQANPDAGTALAALRFDVLADCAWSALAAGHLGCCGEHCPGASQRLGTRRGRAATVNVAMPFTTLAGINDEPGELAGYGPITAEAARRIAGDAVQRRLLTDPASGGAAGLRFDPVRPAAAAGRARDRPGPDLPVRYL